MNRQIINVLFVKQNWYKLRFYFFMLMLWLVVHSETIYNIVKKIF